MLEVDFHHYRVADALERVHQIISEARMSGGRTEVRLITGHGSIKVEIIQLLTKYDIEHNIKLGNSGTIVAVID